MMMMMMMVMTLIMKIIFLHFNNHKNALEILLKFFYKFFNNLFVIDKYKNTIAVFADFRQVNFLLDKTPLGENGCLSSPYFLLTDCLGIQFLNSLPFLTHSVRLPLVTYLSLCSTCVTYRTLCHGIGHQVLPT